jgi:SAM-dependent methyltransferase
MDRSLLAELIQDDPFQPATQVWRSVEVRKLLDEGLPEGRGLDLGCGDGRLTRRLLARGGRRQIVGVEPDGAEAELAARAGIYVAVHVVGGDLVPEPDASFDWVLSNSVLEHIEGIEGVLREVARLLRPGGLFIFTVPAPEFHEALRGPLLPWRSRQRYLSDLDARVAHLRYWDAEEWRRRLAVCGLRLEVADGYLGRAEVRRWETVSRFTAGLLYGFLRRRRQPIEIQKALGIRRHRPRLPVWFTRGLAALLSTDDEGGAPFGCLYVRARKAS